MKKTLAFLTASVMTLASLPILAVSAEEQFVSGDVDMDGYITGHDAALVSRHLLDDTFTLPDTSLALADVNADGVVDQADADWIFENKEYALGDVDLDGQHTIEDAFELLVDYSSRSAGKEGHLTQLQKNLGDVNAKEENGLDEAYDNLLVYSYNCAGAYSELKQEFGLGVYANRDGIRRYYFDAQQKPTGEGTDYVIFDAQCGDKTYQG